MWLPQLRNLSADFSTLAVDLPGHRFSEGQPATRVEPYAEYLQDFTTSLNLPPFVLIGHSLGGAVAVTYALRHPEQLQAVILISTGGALRIAPKVRGLLRQGDYAKINSCTYGPCAGQELLAKGERMFRSIPLQVFYADLETCEHYDALNRLKEITLPTLIICGEQDQITPPRLSRFIAGQIGGAKLCLLPDCGHMPILEKPAAVNERIRSFVRSVQKQAVNKK